MADFKVAGNRLNVAGSLDSRAESELRRSCIELSLADAESVVVDLSGVDYVTSSCIGILIGLWIDLCAAKKGMEIVSSPVVDKLLDIGGLGTVFNPAPSESEPETSGGKE